jgi:hypothetical protein
MAHPHERGAKVGVRPCRRHSSVGQGKWPGAVALCQSSTVRQQLEHVDAGVRIAVAESLMHAFLERTGVAGKDPSRRYLWTDAYAIFALIGLCGRTSRQEHLDSALALAQRVHHELGRFRPDDSRSGWISGLSEEEGERRPTAGGLRIGKPEPERPPGAMLDERFEWDRDGQYFHYLTRWMVALNRLAHAKGDPIWNDWAVDLAGASWPAFAAPADRSGTPRMHWKMSTDLQRPLVASMGHHDPIDGMVACAELRASQRALGGHRSHGALDRVWVDMFMMCDRTSSWATADALGIGGLLQATATLIRLVAQGQCEPGHTLERALVDAARSLDAFVSSGDAERPPAGRLAFRELGLALGLHAILRVKPIVIHAHSRFGSAHDAERLLGSLQAIHEHMHIRDEIEQCWMSPAAQATAAWRHHEDINAVMLAASLVPDACITPCAPTVQEPL